MQKWFKKQFWACFLAVCLLFSSVLTLFMFVGSNKVLKYIDQTIQKVESRNLAFGVDSLDGHVFLQNNDDNQQFKILFLTDLHISASITTFWQDKMLVDAVKKIVTANKPDLILLGGDFIYASIDRLVVNSKNSVKAIASMFEKFEIPWAPIFGNHENDRYATWTKQQIANYFESLQFCLFQSGPANIMGIGNYVIKLLSQSGTLVQGLFMMDTHAYLAPAIYDFVRANQVEWYEQQVEKLATRYGHLPTTQVFLHIPLLDFAIAWDLYSKGSNQVQYHFGDKHKIEPFSPSPIRGKLFDKIVQLGSTKAVYAGHDHYHNFSLTYKGIRLTYNMSMDHNAYYGIAAKTKQRGGTIINVQTNRDFQIFQAPQDNEFLPITE